MNLQGRDCLQEWGTRINVPAILETTCNEIRVELEDAPQEGTDPCDQQQSEALPAIQTQDISETEFPNLQGGRKHS